MFNELLRREYQLEFGPEVWGVHGLTVSSYVLQHPREFGLKPFVRAKLTLEMVFGEGASPEYAERRISRGSVPNTLASEYEEEQEIARQQDVAEGYEITVSDLLRRAGDSHGNKVMEWSREALQGHYEALGNAGQKRVSAK